MLIKFVHTCRQLYMILIEPVLSSILYWNHNRTVTVEILFQQEILLWIETPLSNTQPLKYFIWKHVRFVKVKSAQHIVWLFTWNPQYSLWVDIWNVFGMGSVCMASTTVYWSSMFSNQLVFIDISMMKLVE